MSRSRLVIVSHEITLMSTPLTCLVLSTIAGVLSSPVEVHIIHKLQEHVPVTLRITGSIDTRTATVVIGKQVMMEGSWRASPLTTIATDPFMMSCVIKSLMDDAPLHGREMIVVYCSVLLTTPTKAAVVDDDILGILNTDGTSCDKITFLVFCRILLDTQTGTDITNDDILGPAEV